MTGKDAAYIVATLAAGFVAFKVYQKASSAVDAGVKVADAVIDGVKKVVTEDLNPASDKNIVYSGLSGGVSKITGRETTLGGEIYETVQKVKQWFAPSDKQYVAPRPVDYDAYDFQNVTTSHPPTVTVESPQTAFRISELNVPYETKFDRFLKTIARQ